MRSSLLPRLLCIACVAPASIVAQAATPPDGEAQLRGARDRRRRVSETAQGLHRPACLAA
jgi:hypothetical protein